jgi:hypothetical protein
MPEIDESHMLPVPEDLTADSGPPGNALGSDRDAAWLRAIYDPSAYCQMLLSRNGTTLPNWPRVEACISVDVNMQIESSDDSILDAVQCAADFFAEEAQIFAHTLEQLDAKDITPANAVRLFGLFARRIALGLPESSPISATLRIRHLGRIS